MAAPLLHLSITLQIKSPRCALRRGMYQPTKEPLLQFSDKSCRALLSLVGPSLLELCPALVCCPSD